MSVLSWKELTISCESYDFQQLLSEWRWLVPMNMKPLWLNSFGDWFLESTDGVIRFLDVLEGNFNAIAPSEKGIHDMLEKRENRNRWLMEDWFEICNERGLFLTKDQCYGWKIAPVLGGKLEFQNIQIFDLLVYQSIMGQLHRKTQNVPAGFVISEFKMGRAQ